MPQNAARGILIVEKAQSLHKAPVICVVFTDETLGGASVVRVMYATYGEWLFSLHKVKLSGFQGILGLGEDNPRPGLAQAPGGLGAAVVASAAVCALARTLVTKVIKNHLPAAR